MTNVFDPLTLRGVTARNRLWLAPMCMYSCPQRDGVVTDFHLVHLGSHALGGFGLIVTEASAVVPEGRISPQDAGIWGEEHIEPWSRVVDFVHGQRTPILMQIAHAGRKASTYPPSGPRSGYVPVSEGGWTAVAPSGVPFDILPAPRAVGRDEIAPIVGAFAAAAARAVRAGFDGVEIHAAHGYLLHEFLSPLSNRRDDDYGGSFENRSRIVLEVVDAVRAALGDERLLLIRLSGSDWVEGGWTIEDTVALGVLLVERGVDLIDVSSGGTSPSQQIPLGAGYQVPLAHEVRASTGRPTGTVGLITEPRQAQDVLDAGSADVVLVGRAGLREPAWPLRVAHELGVSRDTAPYAPQYLRGAWPRPSHPARR